MTRTTLPPSRQAGQPGGVGLARRNSLQPLRAAGPRLLVVHADADGAARIRRSLLASEIVPSEIRHAARLEEALRRLEETEFDGVLLDLDVAGEQGTEAVLSIRSVAPAVPIVCIGGRLGTAGAEEALRSGAQEFVPDGSLDGPLLARSLRYAIEQDRSERFIHRLTYHDLLTGLPNRTFLDDLLVRALDRARTRDTLVAVLYVDVDRLRSINRSLGHSAGDTLLTAVAERLRDDAKSVETVARVGADEFALLVTDQTTVEGVTLVARNVLGSLSEPFRIGGEELFVSASVGIALWPGGGEDPDALLRNSDVAMRRAKRQGPDSFEFYAPSMAEQDPESLRMSSALRHAIDRNEILLHYQPQMDARAGTIIGFEALMRWRHPSWGMVPPVRFIPLAEETGLIVGLGEWALRQACGEFESWRRQGIHAGSVAVNVSAIQLTDPAFPDRVRQILRETGLPPELLEIEITESAMIHNEESAAGTLQDLRSRGVRVSLDDFGTGYGSLAALKRFPIDALKIDRTFIADLLRNDDDAAIVAGIITIARGMGQRVIAEGVETREQVALLLAKDCTLMQGNYFSTPIPSERIAPFIRRRRA